MTRPANENSHGPSTPKINKQDTSIINEKTHTAYEITKNKEKEKNPHHKENSIHSNKPNIQGNPEAL